MSDGLIKIELAGIELDRPNRNNRVYPSAEFKRELDHRVAGGQLMVVWPEPGGGPQTEVNPKECVGIVRAWDEKGGEISLFVKPIDASAFDLDGVEYVPRGLGRIGPGGTVQDYRMLCICVVPRGSRTSVDQLEASHGNG